MQQLSALPFRVARKALQESTVSQRPLGGVLADSLAIGEGLARLPFKATSAVLDEMARMRPSLEQRVAALEQKAGIEPPAPAGSAENTAQG